MTEKHWLIDLQTFKEKHFLQTKVDLNTSSYGEMIVSLDGRLGWVKGRGQVPHTLKRHLKGEFTLEGRRLFCEANAQDWYRPKPGAVDKTRVKSKKLLFWTAAAALAVTGLLLFQYFFR